MGDLDPYSGPRTLHRMIDDLWTAITSPDPALWHQALRRLAEPELVAGLDAGRVPVADAAVAAGWTRAEVNAAFDGAVAAGRAARDLSRSLVTVHSFRGPERLRELVPGLRQSDDHLAAQIDLARPEVERVAMDAIRAADRLARIAGQLGGPAASQTRDGMAAAKDIAAMLGLDSGKVKVELTRLYATLPDCRIDVPSPRKGEPRHLYRLGDVIPHLRRHFKL